MILPSPRRSARSAFYCLALVGLATSSLSGCRSHVVRKGVEKRVTRRLGELLGPAEKYSVRIRGTRDSQLVLGRAKWVEIQATRLRARGQFEIESLALTLEDLRYEGGDPSFVSVGKSDLSLTFTEGALNQYLKAFHARYEPEVVLEADRVRVKMVYPFLGKPTPLRAEGHFVIREGRQLYFKAERAEVSFINRPGFGERFIEDRVNPLLDLGRIDFPVRLESVHLLPGKLKAHGTATLPREATD